MEGGATLRFVLLALAVIALTGVPDALAQDSVMTPHSLVGMHQRDGSILLTWSPSPGAARYVILGGPAPDALAPIGETALTFFQTQAEKGPHFGVVPISPMGGRGDPRTVDMTGRDCVATSTSLQFSLSVQSCLRLLP